jgi:hypothetical protein
MLPRAPPATATIAAEPLPNAPTARENDGMGIVFGLGVVVLILVLVVVAVVIVVGRS